MDAPVDRSRVSSVSGETLQSFAERRHRRLLAQWDDHTQTLVRDGGATREAFYLDVALPDLKARQWSTEAVLPTTPVSQFTEHSDHYRQIFADEILGTFDDPPPPPKPRSRFIKQTDLWVAHDVVLDVADGLFAWGILMRPRDLRPGEVRPAVVLQHGRNGLPEKIMDGGYNGIADKLLRRGYIVFAPHNLYRGEDDYRWLDRKANAIGKTLFSFLLLQHDRITRWLADLPQVDGERIAFYGNSYGGESAVRLPTVLTQYALSICASDFNDWTRKVADTHDPHSFMNSIEWEMPYFNMGSTYSYAEMAYLMIPRPFMVERGHHDLVAPDSGSHTAATTRQYNGNRGKIENSINIVSATYAATHFHNILDAAIYLPKVWAEDPQRRIDRSPMVSRSWDGPLTHCMAVMASSSTRRMSVNLRSLWRFPKASRCG